MRPHSKSDWRACRGAESQTYVQEDYDYIQSSTQRMAKMDLSGDAKRLRAARYAQQTQVLQALALLEEEEEAQAAEEALGEEADLLGRHGARGLTVRGRVGEQVEGGQESGAGGVLCDGAGGGGGGGGATGGGGGGDVDGYRYLANAEVRTLRVPGAVMAKFGDPRRPALSHSGPRPLDR